MNSYLDRKGKVLGMIHLKNLFPAQPRSGSVKDLADFVTPVQLVPPNLPAVDLFRRFRQGVPHFAMVGHKGQHPVGFITLDNLLAALVGEIRDEFRQAHNDWTRLDDGMRSRKALKPLSRMARCTSWCPSKACAR